MDYFSGINMDLRAFILEKDMEGEKEIKIKVMERQFFPVSKVRWV